MMKLWCMHPMNKQSPVISQGGTTIGVRCDACATIVQAMCPYCRVTFKDLDKHLTLAKGCQLLHQARFKRPKSSGNQGNFD